MAQMTIYRKGEELIVELDGIFVHDPGEPDHYEDIKATKLGTDEEVELTDEEDEGANEILLGDGG